MSTSFVLDYLCIHDSIQMARAVVSWVPSGCCKAERMWLDLEAPYVRRYVSTVRRSSTTPRHAVHAMDAIIRTRTRHTHIYCSYRCTLYRRGCPGLGRKRSLQ